MIIKKRKWHSGIYIQRPNIIVFPGSSLAWNEAIDGIKKIYSLVVEGKEKSIVIDFQKLIQIYPNGIVPLISEIDRRRKMNNIEFSFIYPTNKDTYQYAERLGWISHLDLYAKKSIGFSKLTNSALKIFHNDDELNDCVSEAIEICSKQLEFAKGSIESFEWALNEIAGNILVHADTEKGWMQVLANKFKRRIDILVCDCGMSIPVNIKRAFPHIMSDAEALQEAVKKGVTTNPENGQGNGLAGALAITQASQGYLRIVSGKGEIVVDNGTIKSRPCFPPIYGTIVEMHFSAKNPIDLPRTLWGTEPSSFLELQYDLDDGEHIDFRLKDHANNFGNRPTGEKLRNLIINILNTNPGKYILIDMADIVIIASSFADEFLGKLAIRFGFVDFIAYIRFANVNPLCKDLINLAVMQRIVQYYGAKNVTLVKDFE